MQPSRAAGMAPHPAIDTRPSSQLFLYRCHPPRHTIAWRRAQQAALSAWRASAGSRSSSGPDSGRRWLTHEYRPEVPELGRGTWDRARGRPRVEAIGDRGAASHSTATLASPLASRALGPRALVEAGTGGVIGRRWTPITVRLQGPAWQGRGTTAATGWAALPGPVLPLGAVSAKQNQTAI